MSMQRATAIALPDRDETLRRLREMTALLESGDEAGFAAGFGALAQARSQDLFMGLARVTHEFHQAVRGLSLDERLNQLAASELPEASTRLDYVVQLTEKAVHRTLDLVDRSRAATERLTGAAGELAEARESAERHAATPWALHALSAATRKAQERIYRDSVELRGHLSQLAQAQEFQDLAGQVIGRVIALVQNIEGALIDLLRGSGAGLQFRGKPPIDQASGLLGPVVPGTGTAAASQQDADELLASLGF